MADLITHACVAFGWKAASRGSHVPVFVVGSMLPDLVCRLPAIGFTALARWGLPVPWPLLLGWEPLHLPVGMVLSSWVLSLFFREGQRPAIFVNLLGGMGLHLALDLLQDHHGVGYMLFFPASLPPFELGWIGSEDSVLVSLPLFVLTVLIWWRRGWKTIEAGRDP